jgi:hypothetical protein
MGINSQCLKQTIFNADQFLKLGEVKQAQVAHTCNPRYLGVWYQEDLY